MMVSMWPGERGRNPGSAGPYFLGLGHQGLRVETDINKSYTDKWQILPGTGTLLNEHLFYELRSECVYPGEEGRKLPGGGNSTGTGWVGGTQYVWGPGGDWHSSRGGEKKRIGWDEAGDVQGRSHRSIAGSLSSWRIMGTISGGLESGVRACNLSLRFSVGQNFLDSVQNNIISFHFLVSEGPVFGWCPMSVQSEPGSIEILESPWAGSPRRVSISGGHQEFFVSQWRLVYG